MALYRWVSYVRMYVCGIIQMGKLCEDVCMWHYNRWVSYVRMFVCGIIQMGKLCEDVCMWHYTDG